MFGHNPGFHLFANMLLQEDWIVGLYLLEVLDLVNFLMVGVMFLALYGALKHVRPAAMVVALAFCLMGVTLILATDQTLSLLALSRQHAAATSPEQRALLDAAGEALLAMDNPSVLGTGTGSSTGLFLVLLAGIVASAVMLRCDGVFSKATGIIGLIANGVNILVFPLLILIPSYYYLPTPISAPFRVAWLVMVGIGLWKLGRRRGGSKGGLGIGTASSSGHDTYSGLGDDHSP